jgi:tRNA A37 threonylcarbamoyladenosine modification protein TsaB
MGVTRVIPLQAAGRAELAWAIYEAKDEALVEATEPNLGRIGDITAVLQPGDVVCGDTAQLDDAARAALTYAGARIVTLPASRVLAIAALGWQRLQRGQIDNPDTLVPLYLRPPAIGPQPPR